jgi:hypothetical protein
VEKLRWRNEQYVLVFGMEVDHGNDVPDVTPPSLGLPLHGRRDFHEEFCSVVYLE